jgi:hypothetical protein
VLGRHLASGFSHLLATFDDISYTAAITTTAEPCCDGYSAGLDRGHTNGDDMDIKPISGRSSSPIIAYYLRGSETGFFVATDALLNAATTREIELLLESQRMEYVSKTRQSLMKKHLVAERREILDSKSNRVRGSYPNSDNANELARRVHVISQTMLYERPNAKTGCMFRLSLPNETTKEQTLDIIRTIRNHFPANVPAMFTVHYGGRGEDGKTDKNLHLQGWFSVKPWESCGWGASLKEFTTMEGVR